ncbi:MAG TPA: hypothetical protein PLI51_08005 [bacterium]|nr:hypothetical protein [bacterium]HPQ66652.1 hypothetical protein [bacterium]
MSADDDVIRRYGGVPLKPEDVTPYERWAMSYFRDRDLVSDPEMEVTVRLDITRVEEEYARAGAEAEGGTLTAFLTWRLLRALALHPCFNLRFLGGSWYRFPSPPLFFPVLGSGDRRFLDILIEGAALMPWEEFARVQHRRIEEARARPEACPPVDEETWSVAVFIGNLPYLDFTSLGIFRNVRHSGRPVFYFGRRSRGEGRLTVPLYVRFDHASTDPLLLDGLIRDFLAGAS